MANILKKQTYLILAAILFAGISVSHGSGNAPSCEPKIESPPDIVYVAKAQAISTLYEVAMLKAKIEEVTEDAANVDGNVNPSGGQAELVALTPRPAFGLPDIRRQVSVTDYITYIVKKIHPGSNYTLYNSHALIGNSKAYMRLSS